MSGSVNLNIPSYLPTLFASSSPGNSLLATLYGNAGSTTRGTINPIAALLQARTGEAKQVAVIAAQPQIKRDIAEFTAALAAAKTPAQLLANPAALKILLTANGLGDQLTYTALATKALLSDGSKPNSLASQLPNSLWLSTNKALSFATKGLTLLNDPKALAAITNGLCRGVVANRSGPDHPRPVESPRLSGTRIDNHQRRSGALGDPTFRDVITTALGIPKEIAFQEITAQERAISNRIDLKQFKDAKFVAQFTQRYLIAAQQAASFATGVPDLSTLAGQSAGLLV